MHNFYLDVIKKSPLFHVAHPVSDLQLLTPAMRRKVAACLKDLAAHGIVGHVQETYRSAELQRLYFKSGVTKLKNVGVHHYGLACDIVFLDRHGNIDWNCSYEPLKEVAKAHSLVYGGDWGEPNKPHSFRDNDHVQLCGMEMQPYLFNGTWFPDDNYVPRHIG